MGISNYIGTESSKNTIRWTTIEPYKVKLIDINKARDAGRINAREKTHCQSSNKYNTTELTNEEKASFGNIKEDINEKKEIIFIIFNKVKGVVKNKISQLNSNFSLEKLENKYESNLGLEESSFKQALISESNNILGKTIHLKYFRVTNKLTHRDADYPKSTVFFWGIFFLVLVLEAVANAYFYAQGSDLGLLGGVLQAFLVSVANVVLSFGIGFILFRYTNHISIVKKSLAWIGIVLSFCILTFLHLVTAHYRELLIKFPDDATKKVLFDTWNHPFAISDMDSLILIIIGFTISIFVMLKSYHYDDTYPGYGKEWRKWIEADEKKSKHIQNYKKNVNLLVENLESDIDRLNDNIKVESEDFTKTISNLEGFHETVKVYCDGVNDAANTLSRSYRLGYNEVVDYEALLSNDVTKEMITYELGTNNILKDASNILNESKHEKKKYDTHSDPIEQEQEQGNVVRKIKNLRNFMTEENKINKLMDEALEKAKQQQMEIGTGK